MLNRELRQMTPWLLAPGPELAATNTAAAVQVRAKLTAPDGTSGFLLCVNTSTNTVETRITVPALNRRQVHLRDLAGQRLGQFKQGTYTQRLEPLATRAAFWGREPKINASP